MRFAFNFWIWKILFFMKIVFTFFFRKKVHIFKGTTPILTFLDVFRQFSAPFPATLANCNYPSSLCKKFRGSEPSVGAGRRAQRGQNDPRHGPPGWKINFAETHFFGFSVFWTAFSVYSNRKKTFLSKSCIFPSVKWRPGWDLVVFWPFFCKKNFFSEILFSTSSLY